MIFSTSYSPLFPTIGLVKNPRRGPSTFAVCQALPLVPDNVNQHVEHQCGDEISRVQIIVGHDSHSLEEHNSVPFPSGGDLVGQNDYLIGFSYLYRADKTDWSCQYSLLLR